MNAMLLERAKTNRDDAIARARFEGTPLRQIADAAQLSVSRVKQMPPQADGHAATHPPVTEVDISVMSSDNAAERVFGIEEVDPALPRWSSERAFIDADPQRHPFADIALGIVDLDPAHPWHICYSTQTHEVYAWSQQTQDPGYPADDPSSYVPGQTVGPCLLLGHLYSLDLAIRGISEPAVNVSYRPGGLAWVYGRIRLLNGLLKVMASDYTLATGLDGLYEYLEQTRNAELSWADIGREADALQALRDRWASEESNPRRIRAMLSAEPPDPEKDPRAFGGTTSEETVRRNHDDWLREREHLRAQ